LIHVKDGLKTGDIVLLTPPLKDAGNDAAPLTDPDPLPEQEK
jgi:HlyD family secretion protein